MSEGRRDEWRDLAEAMAHETGWPFEKYRYACSLAALKGYDTREMREVFRNTMAIDPEGLVMAMVDRSAPSV